MKKALLGFGISLIALSACTPAQPPQAQSAADQSRMGQVSYGMLGPGPINYGQIRDEPTYGYNGELPRSSFRTTSTHRPDFGDDQDKIREIVAQKEGINPGYVVIAGKHAWVNVRFAGDYSDQERQQKLKSVRQSLEQGIPRYQVHLNEMDQ
ncbi:hypothetical protein [Desertibacillus haloalkaliphilus]|uniref:hypothetical protein n=1 Tax=Desertibacillus haloalkaliphilus TaxID=1328930 RepID=UPI001C26D9C8|nr:hypothetical protein [Desertibacillus haloalkaliphilus]MBU8905865.1 hypothetical protein [Desertibacillus haloalkaliphilus]